MSDSPASDKLMKYLAKFVLASTIRLSECTQCSILNRRHLKRDESIGEATHVKTQEALECQIKMESFGMLAPL